MELGVEQAVAVVELYGTQAAELHVVVVVELLDELAATGAVDEGGGEDVVFADVLIAVVYGEVRHPAAGDGVLSGCDELAKLEYGVVLALDGLEVVHLVAETGGIVEGAVFGGYGVGFAYLLVGFGYVGVFG